jgi:hypothetical protein
VGIVWLFFSFPACLGAAKFEYETVSAAMEMRVGVLDRPMGWMDQDR